MFSCLLDVYVVWQRRCSKKEALHVLTELRSVIAVRAKDTEERERAAILKQRLNGVPPLVDQATNHGEGFSANTVAIGATGVNVASDRSGCGSSKNDDARHDICNIGNVDTLCRPWRLADASCLLSNENSGSRDAVDLTTDKLSDKINSLACTDNRVSVEVTVHRNQAENNFKNYSSEHGDDRVSVRSAERCSQDENNGLSEGGHGVINSVGRMVTVSSRGCGYAINDDVGTSKSDTMGEPGSREIGHGANDSGGMDSSSGGYVSEGWPGSRGGDECGGGFASMVARLAVEKSHEMKNSGMSAVETFGDDYNSDDDGDDCQSDVDGDVYGGLTDEDNNEDDEK